MKILVIEDEELTRKALEFRLKKEGYEVIACMDGREGLQRINDPGIDLIITDIMLPFNSGLEIVNYMKTKMDKKIPVIILSALGLEDIVLEAFKLGADDFMTKPFSTNELSFRIKKFLA